jgi:ornithine cyclodeaminase
MGMGISDLSLGTEIYRRALARGRGRPFPHPERAKPRLTAARPT